MLTKSHRGFARNFVRLPRSYFKIDVCSETHRSSTQDLVFTARPMLLGHLLCLRRGLYRTRPGSSSSSPSWIACNSVNRRIFRVTAWNGRGQPGRAVQADNVGLPLANQIKQGTNIHLVHAWRPRSRGKSWNTREGHSRQALPVTSESLLPAPRALRIFGVHRDDL